MSLKSLLLEVTPILLAVAALYGVAWLVVQRLVF